MLTSALVSQSGPAGVPLDQGAGVTVCVQVEAEQDSQLLPGEGSKCWALWAGPLASSSCIMAARPPSAAAAGRSSHQWCLKIQLDFAMLDNPCLQGTPYFVSISRKTILQENLHRLPFVLR